MLGQLLDGRYKVLRVLGAGGFGQTFVAEDTKRPGNPVCVVKHLKPASSDPNFLETARRMFHSEGETLERLGDHAQIPRLLATFEQNREFYLVQEYIEGQPLSAELRPGKKWTENQVIDLLREVLVILAFVHQNGVIHRDVKPDNIIRRRTDNKLVLVDFGAVKQVRTQTTTGGGLMSATIAIGTPGYMPSEQGIGKPKPCSDIYALGVIAIQALTGLSPSPQQEDTDTGFRYDQNTGEIIWQDKVRASPGLAAVLNKMVKPNFPDRYTTTSEALQALEHLQFGYTPTVPANLQAYTPTVPNNPPPSKGSTVNINKTINQQRQDTSPQYERTRSSGSNKLVLAGGILLSVLIGGGMVYFGIPSKPLPTVSSSPIPTPTTTQTNNSTDKKTSDSTNTTTGNSTDKKTNNSSNTTTNDSTNTTTDNSTSTTTGNSTDKKTNNSSNTTTNDSTNTTTGNSTPTQNTTPEASKSPTQPDPITISGNYNFIQNANPPYPQPKCNEFTNNFTVAISGNKTFTINGSMQNGTVFSEGRYELSIPTSGFDFEEFKKIGGTSIYELVLYPSSTAINGNKTTHDNNYSQRAFIYIFPSGYWLGLDHVPCLFLRTVG